MNTDTKVVPTTPRTDAAWKSNRARSFLDCVSKEFACDLERELSTARANLRKYGRHTDKCYWDRWVRFQDTGKVTSECTCGLDAALAQAE